MQSVSLENAQSDLAGLIAALKPGDEVVITRSDMPIARLRVESSPAVERRKPGSAAGEIEIISEDDEHLNDFREYMP